MSKDEAFRMRSKGGKNRAANMTKAQRSAAARKAALARWAKRKLAGGDA